jgi:hypothetical protein
MLAGFPRDCGNTNISLWGTPVAGPDWQLVSLIRPLGVAIGAALIAAYYLFFMKVLWRLLPASIRARIPYDAKEASESKGDIKSFWDLRKLVLPTRN